MISFLQRLFKKEQTNVSKRFTNFEIIEPRRCGLTDAVQSGWYQPENGELFRGFRIEASDTVLDYGCGDGGASMYAARQGAAVIYADTDRAKIQSIDMRIAATSARSAQGIYCESDILPLANDLVTKVVAMEVLEHVEDPLITLSELVRVAAPDALFLLTVPDPVSERMQKWVAPAAHFEPPNHVRVIERQEFEQLIERAGLIIVDRDLGGFYWSLWMCFYWACQQASGKQDRGATLDKIEPPYHTLLEQWSTTWFTFINMPESAVLKTKLDQFFPKSQILIARKASR